MSLDNGHSREMELPEMKLPNYVKIDYSEQVIHSGEQSFKKSFSVYELVSGELGWSTPDDYGVLHVSEGELEKLAMEHPAIRIQLIDGPRIYVLKDVMAKSATRIDVGYILYAIAPREVRTNARNTAATMASENPNLVQRILSDVRSK